MWLIAFCCFKFPLPFQSLSLCLTSCLGLLSGVFGITIKMSCWNGTAQISSAPSNKNICLLLLGRLAVRELLRNPWLLLGTTEGAGGAPVLEQAIAGESEHLLLQHILSLPCAGLCSLAMVHSPWLLKKSQQCRMWLPCSFSLIL